MDITSNLGLYIPGREDVFNLDIINDNFKKLDNTLAGLVPSEPAKIKKVPITFANAPWWVNESDPNNLVEKAKSTIKSDIDKFKEAGSEMVDIIVHVIPDESSEVKFRAIETLDGMMYAYDYMKSIGMDCDNIRFYIYQKGNFQYYKDNMEKFKVFWKDLIIQWMENFKGKIKNYTIFNELKEVYNNSSLIDFVLDIINTVKQAGNVPMINTMNVIELSTLHSSIKNELSVFCCNCYPVVSYNGKNATLSNSINSWNETLLLFKALKQQYPNNDIIISEFGCQDEWIALTNPGVYTWNKTGYAKSNGKAPALVIEGLFNSEIVNYISKATFWYYDMLFSDEVKKVLTNYLGGN